MSKGNYTPKCIELWEEERSIARGILIYKIAAIVLVVALIICVA